MVEPLCELCCAALAKHLHSSSGHAACEDLLAILPHHLAERVRALLHPDELLLHCARTSSIITAQAWRPHYDEQLRAVVASEMPAAHYGTAVDVCYLPGLLCAYWDEPALGNAPLLQRPPQRFFREALKQLRLLLMLYRASLHPESLRFSWEWEELNAKLGLGEQSHVPALQTKASRGGRGRRRRQRRRRRSTARRTGGGFVLEQREVAADSAASGKARIAASASGGEGCSADFTARLRSCEGELGVAFAAPELFGCSSGALVGVLLRTLLPRAPLLRSLCLRGVSGLTNEAVHLISTHCTVLRSLDLSTNDTACGDDAALHLSNLGELRVLQLCGWKRCTSAGLLAMLRALPRVRELGRSFRGKALVSSELRCLNLAGVSSVDDDFIEGLAASEPGLEDLCVYGCSQLTPAAALTIAHSQLLLRRLNVCGCYKMSASDAVRWITVAHPKLQVYNNSSDGWLICADH